MHHVLVLVGDLAALGEGTAAGPSPLRVAVRIALGVLIALLLSYIVIEQVGTWLRRRSGRD